MQDILALHFVVYAIHETAVMRGLLRMLQGRASGARNATDSQAD